MTAPSNADQTRHADQAMGAVLAADDCTTPKASEANITRPATQPGSSNDPAIGGPGGIDQPTVTPRNRAAADRLIGIGEIRQLFGIGRTAAYDLTHRPGFPAPVPVSRNAYRWWASEVAAFTAALQADSQNAPTGPRRQAQQHTPSQEAAHLRITGRVRAARSRRTPR